MFKKLLFSLFLIGSVASVSAQHAAGTWKVIPMAGTEFDYVQDTPSKVYYLTGGSLYSFDGDETIYYSPGDRISDSGIKTIKYNPDKKYLAVVYNNNNIDLIYDAGKVINLPEIKDAILTVEKTVNSISFGKDRIYIGTAFGIVVYDDNNYHVIESGIYNKNIPFVFELGDHIVVVTNDDTMVSPKKERHNSLDKFQRVGSAVVKDNIYAVSPSDFISLYGNDLVKLNINFDTNALMNVGTTAVTGGKNIYPYGSGYYVSGNNNFYLFDANGNSAGAQAFDTSYNGKKMSFWTSPAGVWVADSNGIGKYNLINGATIHSPYFPESSKQFRSFYHVDHPDGKRVFFHNIGNSQFHPATWNANQSYKLLLESYNWETGDIEEYHYNLPTLSNKYEASPGRLLIDPDDPSFMYFASNVFGLYVFKDNEIFYHYDTSNSPIHTVWLNQVFDLAFDAQGNLWIAMWRYNDEYAGSTLSPLKVIPKESLQILKQNPEKLTERTYNSDGSIKGYTYWQDPEFIDGAVGWIDTKVIFSKQSNVTGKGLFSNGQGGAGILVGLDTRNTPQVSDDIYQAYSGMEDQEGTTYNPTYYTCFMEDADGKIWIGTNSGVFVVEDIAQIADRKSNYLSVVRPKVPRNDGTNYADYLLNSDFIIDITIDANNRKWIATTSSGLYCVSPDGTQIISNFTKDNSPLVSNIITMVACDPLGNDVLIGTQEGMYVYGADASPAKEDYSEVYAFPNPVRPDYTGWISINGLMDNSLVKITDAHGNLVWQGNSEGGMAVWDGCDASGNRVRSGVYLVFASQNSSGSASGKAVTKIVVIN